MTITAMFRDGGWGMWPTLICGFVLLAVSARFAHTPERRMVPVLVALNWLMMTTGSLGFITGIITMCRPLSGAGVADASRIAFEGTAESLYNLAFALVFATVAALAATMGAWRLPRTATAAA
jgi:hypothetical protein